MRHDFMSAKKCAMAGAIALAAFAGPAGAGPIKHPRAWSWCMNQAKPFLDQQIMGCTMLIDSAKKKKNIGRVYNNRGLAYYRKGEYDLAVADYDQAINFGYANALYNRGLAKEKLGDKAGAGADMEAFKSAK